MISSPGHWAARGANSAGRPETHRCHRDRPWASLRNGKKSSEERVQHVPGPSDPRGVLAGLPQTTYGLPHRAPLGGSWYDVLNVRRKYWDVIHSSWAKSREVAWSVPRIHQELSTLGHSSFRARPKRGPLVWNFRTWFADSINENKRPVPLAFQGLQKQG